MLQPVNVLFAVSLSQAEVEEEGEQLRPPGFHMILGL